MYLWMNQQEMNKENKYTLELNEKQVQLVLGVLAERPFKEVYELIGEINKQVNKQVHDINKKS